MSEVRVAAAREVDVPAVERLVARTAPLPDAAQPALDWPTVVSALGAFVALLDGRPAGVLVAWPHPDHVRIERVVVDPDLRGASVGEALLAHAERMAADAGVAALRLDPRGVTPGVRAFAARRGFAAGDRFLEKRLDPA